MPGDVIRVVLADDHAVVRAGLRAVLSPAKDIAVVGEASNGREAVAMVERLNPDVVIMDLTMPDMDGTAATKAILAKETSTRVLVLTMHAEEEYLLPLLEAGASGYLVKSAADTELVTAVRAIAHGDPYVSSSASQILIKGLTRKDPAQADQDRYNALTQRERDVLRLIAQGYSAPEIGEQLFISPKTVDTYKQRVNEKLGISHRSEYVDFALKIGILNVPNAPPRT
jgi:DNA-binding NarL/FixJ family response regulator